MKIGIRKRLIISFVLLAVIPVAIIAISMTVTIAKMEGKIGDDPQNDPSEQIRQIFNAVSETIEINYPHIEDYDRFYAELEPLVEAYQFHIQIVDKQGILAFDSQDKAASMKPADPALIELARTVGQSSGISKMFLYGIPIMVEGEQTATAVVLFNSSAEPFSVLVDAIKGMILSFGLGLLSFILLIILFTWNVSRTILRPLKELNKATEKIAKGDLEFNIHYTNNDELGSFAGSFESMRLQLKESLQKQKAIEETRKEMIASISHDLRTPISSIQGYVEGLKDGVADDEETRNRYLSVIRDKTFQLNRQIDDLFEYSKLDAGQLRLRIEVVDSRVMLENILQSVELRRGDRGPCLEIIRPLPSVSLKVDSHRLEQVLMNLLENAFRYVPEEGWVKVKSWVEDSNLVVAVEDNGPGIPQQHIPHLFKSFFRGEKSRSRRSGGTGLGLAISKYIVEAHSGRIWVESQEGQGSTFCFSLPI